jgi:hypothetical protein
MILVAEADSGVPMRGTEKLEVMEKKRRANERKKQNLLATRQYQILSRLDSAKFAPCCVSSRKKAAANSRQPNGVHQDVNCFSSQSLA